MKTKGICVGFYEVFVTYILHMFDEGTVSGPAEIISVFNFSPHVVK
jgi:hypothetical protein